jgi:hypothetical protein
MAKIKKIHLNPGDMFEVMVVYEPREASAAGFREQVSQCSILAMLSKHLEICVADPRYSGTWPTHPTKDKSHE